MRLSVDGYTYSIAVIVYVNGKYQQRAGTPPGCVYPLPYGATAGKCSGTNISV